jgi:hypothetical protein
MSSLIGVFLFARVPSTCKVETFFSSLIPCLLAPPQAQRTWAFERESGRSLGEVALAHEGTDFVLEVELQSEGDLPRCSDGVCTGSGSGA